MKTILEYNQNFQCKTTIHRIFLKLINWFSLLLAEQILSKVFVMKIFQIINIHF